jgi:hypothetical protein
VTVNSITYVNASPGEAWGEVGRALYDVPDVELTALAAQLRELAAFDPGRAANVLLAFAAMVETERSWRERDMANVRAKANRR